MPKGLSGAHEMSQHPSPLTAPVIRIFVCTAALKTAHLVANHNFLGFWDIPAHTGRSFVLIANKKLDLRIGINKDKEGNYLQSHDSYYHPKVLIFEDYEGNKIQIDGGYSSTFKVAVC